MNYRQYLNSDIWDKRRRAAIVRAKGKCASCGDRGVRLEVHHKTYERLGNERPSDLVALCSGCHWEADQVRKGVDLPPEKPLPDYEFEPYENYKDSVLKRYVPKANRGKRQVR